MPRVEWFHYLVTVVIAYFVGSVPTGFLIARSRGVDIRKVGSGNMGATNVFRALGKKAGTIVLLIDILKGWLACQVAAQLVVHWAASGPEYPVHMHERFLIIAGVCAILGHNYTCWLSFKGGKGIATSAGVLLAWVPWVFLIVVALWGVIFKATRYVSLASIIAAAMLPVITWLLGRSPVMIVVTACLAAMAIWKHRSNIQRLLAGTENRFVKKKKETSDA